MQTQNYAHQLNMHVSVPVPNNLRYCFGSLTLRQHLVLTAAGAHGDTAADDVDDDDDDVADADVHVDVDADVDVEC